MKKHLINNNSNKLLIFFTGWGCDEFEFKHLKADCDVLLLYDYTDLNLDFDFSKYKTFNLIAFSAGVFVASIFKFNFQIDKIMAISGNPYLFDEKLGLSSEIQNVLQSVTIENAEEFAKNYLVKTNEEWNNFHPSQRTFESCNEELDSLRRIYNENKEKITNIYNTALIGEDDPIFNVSIQKEFYGTKLKTIKNARHNLFFRITNYEQLFEGIK